MPTEKTYDRIVAYLKGKLTGRQRHDLEKEMMRDVFDEEAFEGLSQLSATDLQADMDKLQTSLQNRISQPKKRNLNIYFRIAAGILLLCGLTGLFYIVFRTPATDLISKEEVRKPAPETPAQSAPLMETESAPAEPFVKEYSREKKNEMASSKPAPAPGKNEDVALPVTDTFYAKDDMVVADEVEVTAIAKMEKKSPDRPLTSEPAPEQPIRPEEAMKGRAAGVQITSRSNSESAELNKALVYPVVSNPVPPGGSVKDFKKWVTDRLDYPAYKEFPGKHKISVNLTVHANGTISNIRVSKNAPGVIAADLEKIISQSSLWTAALKDDNPVDADVVIHFVITVE
jgi:hypothetical protein